MTAASSSPAIADAPGWRERVVLLLLTGLALAVRLFHVGQWSWSAEEAVTWRAITQPLAGVDGFASSADSGSPLFYLLLRWLLENDLLRSATQGSLRLLPVFAGVCTVPLLALAARPWLGARGALLAALLLAIHPEHVLASQTAAPLVVAMPLQLAAVALAVRRRFVASAVLALLAGLCGPGGWFAFAGLAAAALPAQGLRIALPLLAMVALPQWLLGMSQVGVVVLVPALLAALAAPALSPVLWFAAAAPAAWAWIGGDGAQSAAFRSTLPLLVVFAAHGVAVLTGWLLAPSASRGVWRYAGLATPGLLLGLGLAVPTFLDLTLHRGQRPEWQQAAQVALRTVTAGGRLVVGAAAGHGPLLCYLRPEHHRSRNDDPHPRRIVQELPLRDGEAALRALLAASGPARALLVLTTGERDVLAAQPAAAALLQTAFECKAVLPGPRPGHDEAVLVWLARAGG